MLKLTEMNDVSIQRPSEYLLVKVSLFELVEQPL